MLGAWAAETAKFDCVRVAHRMASTKCLHFMSVIEVGSNRGGFIKETQCSKNYDLLNIARQSIRFDNWELYANPFAGTAS